MRIPILQPSLILRYLRPKGVSWINYSTPLLVVWKKKCLQHCSLGHAFPRRKKRPWIHRDPSHSRKGEGVLVPTHICCLASCPWPVIAHAAMRSLAVLGAQSLNSGTQGAQHFPCSYIIKLCTQSMILQNEAIVSSHKTDH